MAVLPSVGRQDEGRSSMLAVLLAVVEALLLSGGATLDAVDALDPHGVQLDDPFDVQPATTNAAGMSPSSAKRDNRRSA